MAKTNKTIYFCENCGYESSKWVGQCPACNEWNTMVEHTVSASKAKGIAKAIDENRKPVAISAISVTDEDRYSTGFNEFNRVLGGGIVSGALLLVGGDPGIGKSTLLLQMCKNISQKNTEILYASGEESLKQIKLRANRMGEFNDSLKLLSETNLDIIENIIERTKPKIVIIDSIQTMYSESVDSAPGSISQIKQSTSVLMQIAKRLNISIVIVGHVTKGGDVAGPRMLEHMVDAVLYLEGDRHSSYRILRGVKNRFGSTNEIGVFEMRSEGLVEVENPSEYMLSGKPDNSPGSVVTCSIEGTRPVLIEVQALVCSSSYAAPMRTATGTDRNRVNLLMAVLDKRVGINISHFDGYVNIAGGMKVTEPAIDLGIVLAIISSYNNKAVESDTVVFGEVGLSGEIRSVTQVEARIKEALKLGFKKVIVPYACKKQIEAIKDEIEKIKVIYLKNLKEILG